MTRCNPLMMLFVLLFGPLPFVQEVLSQSSYNPNCVPPDAYVACQQMKCDMAQHQGLSDRNCSYADLSPLIGGNQCCDRGTVSRLNNRKRRQAYNFDQEPQRKWPNPVSYAFDDNLSLQSFLAAIPSALSHIEAQTCLRFQRVDVNSTTPHITYTGGSSCTAYVGRSDFDSIPITATPDCLSKMGEMLYYTVQTLGMWHQSQRPDRDSYIMINTSNTDETHISDFAILDSSTLVTLGLPYDLVSIQQFPALIYSNNGHFTILTIDPLYQQAIGQRVQLSFQDAKLLNMIYCQGICSSNPLPSGTSCLHGGYQDPNNCTQCKCQDGFAGQFCDQFETATGGVCGGLLNASRTEMNITSPGYYTPGYYDSGIACAWVISAPEGGNISLKFVDPFGLYQDPSYACFHWVEIRYKLLNKTGPRFCGQSRPTVQLYSEGSKVLIIFRSNLSGIATSLRRGFKIAYKIVNAPPCAYVTCLNGGSCVDGNCVCPPGSTGRMCETLSGTSSSPATSQLPLRSTSFPPVLSSSPSSSPPSSCNPNPCRNNGTCTMNGTRVTCTCISGFKGQYCTNAPCGGCNVSPGSVDSKCVIPETPARVCQVTDFVDSSSGWWCWSRRSSRAVTRNVTCTWSVCCDNASDLGYGCGVIGWAEWCSCSVSCGGGVQVRRQYGFRTDRIGNRFYDVVSTQQQNCNTQKCNCAASSDDDDDGYGYSGRGRGSWWNYSPPCQACNGPKFVVSGDQCVPSSSS